MVAGEDLYTAIYADVVSMVRIMEENGIEFTVEPLTSAEGKDGGEGGRSEADPSWGKKIADEERSPRGK